MVDRRARWVIVAGVTGALVIATGALARTSALPVRLAVGATSLQPDQSVALTATARLPKGDRLLIQARLFGGSARKVKECLASPCRARWSESDDAQVTFQALAVKRTGTRTTVLGRSRTVDVTWTAPFTPPPPPPPPPPPLAVPGHYEGKTQDLEVVSFDVSADARRIVGLHTGQINEGCDPPLHIYGNNLSNWNGSIASDGSFAMGYDGPGTIGGNPAVYKIRITGRFTGGGAVSGIVRIDNTFTSKDGIAYTCTSADVNWSATKTA